jgi:uncharacterized membrane protein YoaK (UPF0700 family)
MKQPLIKTQKGRKIILLVTAFISLCSGLLPNNALHFNIAFIIFGMLLIIITSQKSMHSNKIPNIVGNVLATPSNIKKLHNSKLNKNENFSVLLGLAFSLPAVLSLAVRISFF